MFCLLIRTQFFNVGETPYQVLYILPSLIILPLQSCYVPYQITSYQVLYNHQNQISTKNPPKK